MRWAANPKVQSSANTGSTTIQLAEVEVRREVLVFDDDGHQNHDDDASLKKSHPIDV